MPLSNKTIAGYRQKAAELGRTRTASISRDTIHKYALADTFNNELLTDKECLEVILESIKHNDLENPVEECADLHRLITSYISRH
jgi:hypothetical protein